MKTPRFVTNLKTAYGLLDSVSSTMEKNSTPTNVYVSNINLKSKIGTIVSNVSILSLREFLYFTVAAVFLSQGFILVPVSLLALAVIDAIMYLNLINFWAQYA